MKRVAKAYPCFYSKTGIAEIHPEGNGCTCRPISLTKYQTAMLLRIANRKPAHVRGHLRRHTTLTINKLRERALIDWIEDDERKRCDEGEERPDYALTHAGESAAMAAGWSRPETEKGGAE